jgi:antitoxin (DNA-binding transcriptional repressor) of toxin-antitoxin stability system
MISIPLEEAQANLTQLVHRLSPGEEFIITENDLPLARIVRATATQPGKRKLGSMAGSVLSMAEDFDAPLKDFQEYRE